MCMVSLATTSPHAAGLQVTPTTLQLLPEQNADGIYLSNTGDTALTAQVRVFAWSQKDNTDLLTPSSGLIVSPPMLQLAPGAKQLLRVIRTGAALTPGQEQAFRIIVDELPSAQAPVDAPWSSEKTVSTGLQFAMRYSIPVFVGPAPSPELGTQLEWQLTKTPSAWTLAVRNHGATRAQVADFQAQPDSTTPAMLANGLIGYVLAGGNMQWDITPPQKTNAKAPYAAMINRAVQPITVRETP